MDCSRELIYDIDIRGGAGEFAPGILVTRVKFFLQYQLHLGGIWNKKVTRNMKRLKKIDWNSAINRAHCVLTPR